MAANTPALPHNEGDTFTNDDTGIKYQFINGAWRAVSSKAAEDVADALGQIDLEKVLNNGNIADKGFVLTNLENDAILVSPEQARIMVGGVGENVVPKIEMRHTTGAQDTSIVALELDEDGERFDIECDEKVDNIHFRFVNDVKFELNKKGDAVFNGKVKVEPGTVDNEAVTYGQLATVAEEIEQLAPSFERGLYTISTQEVTSSSSHNGKYNLIRKNNSSDNNAARRACEDAKNTCNRIPDNDPIDCENQFLQCEAQIPSVGSVDKYITKFSEVEKLKFSKVDANGEDHTWDGVLIGQLIDVFNEDNDNFMVGRITAIEGTTVKTFTVDVLSSKGTASSNARIKIFTLNEGADVNNYVRKTGDTMDGQLKLTGNSKNSPLFLLEPTESGQTSTLFSINDKNGSEIFEVQNNGQAFYERTPDAESEIVNKQYVDDALTSALAVPARLSWEYKKPSSGKGPADGTFWLDSKHFRFSYKTKNGVNLGSTKPANRDEWYAAGAGDDKGAFDMTLWRKTSSGWYMYDHIECDKTRWSITTDGVTHFQFRRKWASHDKSLSNGQTYYITVAGFF